MFDLDQNKIIDDENEGETPEYANNANEEEEEVDDEENGDLINFKDINSNFQPKNANEANGPEKGEFSNRHDVLDLLSNDKGGSAMSKKQHGKSKSKAVDYDNWSEQSSGGDTERENPKENDDINKIIKGNFIILIFII